MIQQTFTAVSNALRNMAAFLGVSYNEANIITYFVIIPFIWAYMIDRAYKFHYVKLGYASLCLSILVVVDDYSNFCDLFFWVCAMFLSLFYPIGIDYVMASVIFCVIVPVIVHMLLMNKLKSVQL